MNNLASGPSVRLVRMEHSITDFLTSVYLRMKSLNVQNCTVLAKVDGVQAEPAGQAMESPRKENNMQRLHRYLVSFLLGAALIAPVGIQAKDRDDHNCQDKDKRGYYDRNRKDCHGWDDHEDRAYQKWLRAKHKTHREFSRLKAKEQSEYWKWRHEHPDDDRDRH